MGIAMSLLGEFKKLNKVCQKPRYKEVGNWMVRNIIREACVPMTYLLLKTPITANQVTFLSLAFAIAGCVSFLVAKGLPFLWLAVLLHISYYFDHVDGQIARCKGQSSVSGMMFDFITHYIIFSAILLSLGLKAYFESANMFYIYCGMAASISIVSFNLLIDSKYRAFFVKILKHNEVRINKAQAENEKDKRSIPAKFFSLLHKTCEIHIIINTLTVAALLQMFGLEGITASTTWLEVLVVYYAIAVFTIAAVKVFFVVVTRKPDREFKNIFSIEEAKK